MHYSVLTYNSASLREFVSFWSNFYIYPMEDLYAKRIDKKQFVEEDLIKLFEWKNGTRLSKKKEKALQVIISKIGVINSLKSDFSLSRFLEEFKFVKGAIWKIYLLHVICPNGYPIFDQFVYKAYCFLVKDQKMDIPSNNKQKEDIYFSEYVSFFNELSGQNLSRKNLDEALWTFGKFLKTPYGKKI